MSLLVAKQWGPSARNCSEAESRGANLRSCPSLDSGMERLGLEGFVVSQPHKTQLAKYRLESG